MQRLFSKSSVIVLFFMPLIVSLTLSGCGSWSTFSKDDKSKAKDAVAQKKSSDAKAKKEDSVDSKKTEAVALMKEPEPDKKEEPAEKEEVVVIPRVKKPSDDISLEPILEPVAESSPSEMVEIEPKATAASKVKIPTSSDRFIVTVGDKSKEHPFYGKGYPQGFSINNVAGGDVTIERGKAYHFEVATDPKHDVYFSEKEIGWGSTAWSGGVEGAFIYKGTINFTPPNDAPAELYYSCRNHPYMGGKVSIVPKGKSAKLGVAKSTISSSSKTAVAAKSKSNSKVTKAAVNQKLMFAQMLIKSKNAKRVKASNISEAIALHDKAVKLVDTAKSKMSGGDNKSALQAAEQAVVLLKKSSKLVPTKEDQQRFKEQHKEIVASLKDFEESHAKSFKRIVKKQGKSQGVDYNHKEVGGLKASASDFVKKGDYRSANQLLEKAQGIIMVAMRNMLDSKTIVYDLNFDTPQEEYDYELKRYGGYEELIPVAIEIKRPAEGAKMLMRTFLKKAQKIRDMALDKAKGGDHPTAILMLRDATKEVRRALRMVGVMQ